MYIYIDDWIIIFEIKKKKKKKKIKIYLIKYTVDRIKLFLRISRFFNVKSSRQLNALHFILFYFIFF